MLYHAAIPGYNALTSGISPCNGDVSLRGVGHESAVRNLTLTAMIVTNASAGKSNAMATHRVNGAEI